MEKKEALGFCRKLRGAVALITGRVFMRTRLNRPARGIKADIAVLCFPIQLIVDILFKTKLM